MLGLPLAMLSACIPPALEPPGFVDDTGDPVVDTATGDTGPLDTADPGWPGVPVDRPLRLLFLGNSFTAQGPVAALVREVATSVGWPPPEVSAVAPGGQTLAFHRTNPDSLDRVDAGRWDAVVLQDLSTRPTDAAGDPLGFKDDATWFYDRVKASSPDAHVVLYETWARHPDHAIYPDTFVDPAEMQDQLRTHYRDAAESWIPDHATSTPSDDVTMAPVGDAWELHLAEPSPLVLHAGDLYHAGPAGQALNAFVLYSTIYGVVATGAGELSLSPGDAARLQAAADLGTGITTLPPDLGVPKFAVDHTVEVDFGVLRSDGFGSVTNCLTGGASALVDTSGAITPVSVRVTAPFTGSNEDGRPDNLLGWPDTVSSDLCWVGSFDSHDAALLEQSTVVLSNLAAGTYRLTLFASRSGDDGGLGRLTRFTVQGATQDLDASDNTGSVVMFAGLSPDAGGTLTLDVGVSPAGTGRFGYLNALTLTRTSR